MNVTYTTSLYGTLSDSKNKSRCGFNNKEIDILLENSKVSSMFYSYL